MALYLVLTHDEADTIRMCPPHSFDAVERADGTALLPATVVDDPEFLAVLEQERLVIDLTRLEVAP